MEADFDRFYGRDLAATIWLDQWPASKIAARVNALPMNSAYVMAKTNGHTIELEALAQIRDRLDVMARQMKLKGNHEPFRRPGTESKQESVDLSTSEGASKLAGFFGRR